MSARDRMPSGRTNLQISQQAGDEKLNSAIGKRSHKPTNEVSTSFTESAFLSRPQSKGPFSSRYIEPVVPIPVPPTRTRIRQCPDDFIENNQESELPLNVLKLKALTSRGRADFVSSFIERNSDEMWKYDPKFRGKSMQEIYDMIYSKKDFGPAMAKYCNLERQYGISTASKNIRSCLSYGDVEPLRQPTKHDPFIQTLTTSRTSRDERMDAMFKPATSRYVGRCEPHDAQWKNFSSFVSDLKRNESAMLKR